MQVKNSLFEEYRVYLEENETIAYHQWLENRLTSLLWQRVFLVFFVCALTTYILLS